MDRAERATIQALAISSTEQSAAARTALDEQVSGLQEQVDSSDRDAEEARKTAAYACRRRSRLSLTMIGLAS